MIYFFTALFATAVVYRVKPIKNNIASYHEKKNRMVIKINKPELRNFFLLVLSAFPVFLVSALRYGIGTDYFYTYVPRFREICAGERTYYEFLFYILNKVIAVFTNEPQWLIATVSLLFTIFVYKSIYRYSKKMYMSVLLLFVSYAYFVSLNNSRQTLAAAILIWAIGCLYKGDIKRYLIWCVVAGLIHTVAFIGLAFIIVRLVKVRSSTIRQFFYTIVGMVGIKILATFVLNLAIKIPRVALYFKAQEFSQYLEPTISRWNILVNLLIFAIFIYIDLAKPQKTNETIWRTSIWTQTFYLLICACDGIIPATYRILDAITFVQILTVPNAIEECGNVKYRFIFYMAILLLFGILFCNNCVNGVGEVFPYVSIFSK